MVGALLVLGPAGARLQDKADVCGGTLSVISERRECCIQFRNATKSCRCTCVVLFWEAESSAMMSWWTDVMTLVYEAGQVVFGT